MSGGDRSGSPGDRAPWFEGTVNVEVADEARPPATSPPETARGAGAARGAGGTSAARGAGAAGGARRASAALGARPWLEDRGEIAAGGMGRIHRVRDRNLRSQIAMKVLAPSGGASPEDRTRFREEAQITGQLDHPNIPPVHDLWTSEAGELCFTMKLVRGETLADLLLAKPPAARTERDLERFLQIFLRVCDAVAFAHGRGVIHRDLKPENVMVGAHGQVYVMDWGCALVLAGVQPADGEPVSVERDPSVQTLDAPGVAIGTACFMAPEQALALTAQIDERTDVYLLGGLLYSILTGHAPHKGRTIVESIQLAQRGHVRPLEEAAGGVRLPPDLCRIALRALEPQAARRYPSVPDLKEDVERSLRNGWWFASVTLPPGALVVREGEPADAAYIITSGRCEAFRTEHGRRVFLRQMGAGDTFGETAIFTAERRTASVEVVEEMTATVVTREAIESAVGGASWVGSFVRALAERFRELEKRLSYLRQAEEEE